LDAVTDEDRPEGGSRRIRVGMTGQGDVLVRVRVLPEVSADTVGERINQDGQELSLLQGLGGDQFPPAPPADVPRPSGPVPAGARREEALRAAAQPPPDPPEHGHPPAPRRDPRPPAPNPFGGRATISRGGPARLPQWSAPNRG